MCLFWAMLFEELMVILMLPIRVLRGIKMLPHRTTDLEWGQEMRITAFFPVEKSYFEGKVWKFTQMSLLTFLSVNLLLNDLWKETFQSDPELEMCLDLNSPFNIWISQIFKYIGKGDLRHWCSTDSHHILEKECLNVISGLCQEGIVQKTKS